MTRLRTVLATAALSIGAPAWAQSMDHSNMPGMKMPAPAKKPVAKKPAATDPHAGHNMQAKPEQPAPATPPDPHAGHTMPAPTGQPAPATTMPPGHDMSTMPGMTPGQQPPATMPPGHDMSNMPGMTMPGSGPAAGTDLPAGNAPPPPLPTDHAADRVYDPRAMAEGRHHLQQFHGGQKLLRVGFDIAEAQFRKGREGYRWEGDAWYGGDIDRLWVKTEGEGDFGGSLEEAEVQVLYSRAIDPYWNVQGGVRYDFKPDPSRVYATVALEGLAPSFFDVEGALFLSNKGELMARASGWYDQRITQRLILQPRGEVNLAAQNSRSIGVGAGLSDIELGLRLRYDIHRQFAPYVGVEYSRAFGRTRRYLRQEGEDPDSLSFLAGIRFWF